MSHTSCSPHPSPESHAARAPRISVITPSFNQVRFLERSVVSVLDQGYENLEHIVVDGGSCDGSVDVLRRYDDELAWWMSAHDDGPADALNKALRHATGDIVAILPADDVLLPFALQRVAERFAGADAPAWIVGGVGRMDASDRTLDRPAAEPVDTLSACLRHGAAAIPAAATFYRRALLDRFGPLDPTLQHTHLFELNCRLFAAGLTPSRFNQLLALHRVHATSMSARDRVGLRSEESRIVWRHIHEHRPITPRTRYRASAAA